VSVDQYLNIKIANVQVIDPTKNPQLVGAPWCSELPELRSRSQFAIALFEALWFGIFKSQQVKWTQSSYKTQREKKIRDNFLVINYFDRVTTLNSNPLSPFEIKSDSDANVRGLQSSLRSLFPIPPSLGSLPFSGV
jgi:hypothetical protein